jgi:hypothetical protein
MPPITAMLQTCNDAPHLGRALESLRPCDEILIVDLGSTDHTLHIAREYGAVIQNSTPDKPFYSWLHSAQHPWIFCLLPSETLTEYLEASLFEWKLRPASEAAEISSCSVVVKEEAKNSWANPLTSTRLVPRIWTSWDGPLPQRDPRSLLLEGDLLRFRSMSR